LIPRSPEYRNRPARIVGSPPGKAHWGGAEVDILRALDTKAKKYGDLDAPYVIAINILPWFHDKNDISVALYGKGPPRVADDNADFGAVSGFWGSAAVPRKRNVSAVLAVSSLVPTTLHLQKPVLYHNPRATHPVSPGLFAIAQHFQPSPTGQATSLPGDGPSELLRLPVSWPPNWDFDISGRDRTP